MWLALDTSGDAASVAVGNAGAAPRAEEALHGARRHAGALVPMIDRALAEVKLGPAELEGILLADGPGSFTGLRVAASVAKGISTTHGIPLRTASSLLVLAAGALPRESGPLLAVSDALRGELYAAVYEFTEKGVTTRLAPTVLAPETLIERVRPFGIKGIAGVAPEPLLAQVHEALGAARTTPPVSGAAVLLELLPLDGALTPVVDVRSWEPVYGRPAEAQRQWEARHGRPLPPAPRDGD